MNEDEPFEQIRIDSERMDRLYEEIYLEHRQETTFFGLITIGDEKPTVG